MQAIIYLSSDYVVHVLEMYFNSAYLLATMLVNHFSFGSCYRVTTRLAHGLDDVEHPDPWRPALKHHAVLAAAHLARGGIQTYVTFFVENARSTHYSAGLMAVQAVVLASFVLYVFAVWSVSELAIGRLLQVLGSVLSSSLDELSKRRIDVGEFCHRVDTVRQCYETTG